MIRLREISDYGRKQLRRKKKFALINNGMSKPGKRRISEDGNVEIELSGQEVKELDTIFKKFGADLNSVIQVDLDEKKVVPDYTKMSTKELEDLDVVLKIDQSIMDSVDELIEKGNQAKYWYKEMNEKIREAFGESDGTLFLVLLAIFSAGTPLQKNLELAAQTYQGIKRDLSDPKTREFFEVFIALPKAKAFEITFEPPTKAQINKFIKKGKPVPELVKKEKIAAQFHQLATVRGMVKGNLGVGKNFSNLMRILGLYKKSNYSFDRKTVVDEISKHLLPSGALDKSTLVSAEKIFSFTLNLLDPNYKFEGGWLPVTMDTWMAAFFYPSLGKTQQKSLLAKTPNYVYMAKLTQDIAAKYGMEPVEMQAIIWVGILKKTKGENYNTTFDNAIDKSLTKLDVKIEDLKKMNNFLSKVIELIGNAGI